MEGSVKRDIVAMHEKIEMGYGPKVLAVSHDYDEVIEVLSEVNENPFDVEGERSAKVLET